MGPKISVNIVSYSCEFVITVIVITVIVITEFDCITFILREVKHFKVGTINAMSVIQNLGAAVHKGALSSC